MSWQSITAADVLTEWNTKEPALVKNQQAATDNLPAILTRIVNACRGAVRAGGGQIGPDGTIPDQLREEVITIARWRLLLSLPEVNDSMLGKARKDDYTAAQQTLRDVAEGKLKIEVPDTALPTPGPGNAVSIPRPGRPVNSSGFGKMGTS
jgi:hypothetical protein